MGASSSSHKCGNRMQRKLKPYKRAWAKRCQKHEPLKPCPFLAFLLVFKQREQHLPADEIVQHAARAWMNMSNRQRKRYISKGAKHLKKQCLPSRKIRQRRR